MTDANSPIHDFYPTDFRVDMEGKRNDWEGVVLIPFIDEARLLAASHTVGPAKLSKVSALALVHAVHICCLDIFTCAALQMVHHPVLSIVLKPGMFTRNGLALLVVITTDDPQQPLVRPPSAQL